MECHLETECLFEVLNVKYRQAIADAASTNAIRLLTMRVFLQSVGTAAQMAAVNGLSHDGLFLGGGILPKNKELLMAGDFLHALYDHPYPNIQEFLRSIPIYLIDNYDISLTGCFAKWKQANH